MKQIGNAVGGWMWYCDLVKTELARQLSEQEYKDLLKMYIGGKTWMKAVEEMNK